MKNKIWLVIVIQFLNFIAVFYVFITLAGALAMFNRYYAESHSRALTPSLLSYPGMVLAPIADWIALLGAVLVATSVVRRTNLGCCMDAIVLRSVCAIMISALLWQIVIAVGRDSVTLSGNLWKPTFAQYCVNAIWLIVIGFFAIKPIPSEKDNETDSNGT